MRSLIGGLAALLAAIAVLVGGPVGASASNTLKTQHATWTSDWLYDTAVAYETAVPYDTSSEDICALFPGTPYPSWYPAYEFSDVNLTAHVKSTYISASSDGYLWRFKSVARVSGVINASDGTYTVTGGPFKEDRIDPFDYWYFLGSGPLKITGPGGTVIGKATFLDTSHDYPAAMSFVFTSVSKCSLS